VKRLTKDELSDFAKFNFQEKEVELPLKSGKAGLLFRTPSIAENKELEEAQRKHRDGELDRPVVADLLATYCVEPKLSAEEWAKIVVGWPAPIVSKINEAHLELAGISEEVARALATEFLRSGD
jgi:hypothetical protein